MEFKSFNERIQKRFNEMQLTGKLFRSSVTGDELWEMYISSFPSEYDKVFRDPNSTEHNCNICKSFIRRYGNVVSVDNNGKLVSMFGVDADGTEYKESSTKMDQLLVNAPIKDVFFESFNTLNTMNYSKVKKTDTEFQLGLAHNTKRYTKEEAEKYGVVKPNEIVKFNHFHVFIKRAFIITDDKSVETVAGYYRDSKNVFKRAMDELSIDSLKLVKELIIQRSLLDGEPHLNKIDSMIKLKGVYDTIPNNEKDIWIWVNSYDLPYAKFKNELIGELCSDISNGVELNKACEDWNKRVDPINYKKAVAPISKKQKEEAKKFVESNGYTESFNRRLATINDIKISEILHSNSGNGKVKSVSIFDSIEPTKNNNKNKHEFNGIEEVSIDKFMKDILPTCTSVEAYLQPKHSGNMVTLTTSNDDSSKPIFNWGNNYSWTYNGNLAGKSFIAEAVKLAGGKVDGVLRYSIIWNEDGRDVVDFDAIAIEPDRTEIYYGSYKGSAKTRMSGNLDVDMIRPSKLGVENITWSDKSKMKDGTYKFYIKNYDGGNNKGFKAEISFNGEIYSYEYNKPFTGRGKTLSIAEVTLKKGEFTIKHNIEPTGSSSVDIYGLETNNFHKVNLICLSPNHWGDNSVGNKHYFFMLDNCRFESPIRSFHAENLIPELYKHRATLEVLGNNIMLEPSDEQLSGIGFNSTVSEELIVKLEGTFKRVIKIKF